MKPDQPEAFNKCLSRKEHRLEPSLNIFKPGPDAMDAALSMQCEFVKTGRVADAGQKASG